MKLLVTFSEGEPSPHVLVRRLLLYGLGESALPEIKTGPHGKPYFAGYPVKFNLSHCKGAVCCALGEHEVGVDIERVRPYHEKLAERICTPSERKLAENACDPAKALIALWSLKESFLKYTGEGMRYGFQNAEFSFDAQGRPFCAAQNVNCALFEPAPGFVLAACAAGALPEHFSVIDPAYLPSLPHTY